MKFNDPDGISFQGILSFLCLVICWVIKQPYSLLRRRLELELADQDNNQMTIVIGATIWI